MVEPLGVVVLPFQPTSRKRGGDCTTTLRQQDVGAVPPPIKPFQQIIYMMLSMMLSYFPLNKIKYLINQHQNLSLLDEAALPFL